jgi:hypothetical protein
VGEKEGSVDCVGKEAEMCWNEEWMRDGSKQKRKSVEIEERMNR